MGLFVHEEHLHLALRLAAFGHLKLTDLNVRKVVLVLLDRFAAIGLIAAIELEFMQHVFEDPLAWFLFEFVADRAGAWRYVLTPGGKAGRAEMVFAVFTADGVDKDL